jgi:hypothetical protein
MWLPMTFSFNKNETFAAIADGKYSNIRTMQVPNIAVDDSDYADGSAYILPPGTQGKGGFAWRAGWERPTQESVGDFSGACW